MQGKSRNNPARDGTRVPHPHDWRTTDEEDIERRRLRARSEALKVVTLERAGLPFSNFHVESPSGLTYQVEIRELEPNRSACDCVDFRTNGLGTCKHVEAVRTWFEARSARQWKRAVSEGSPRIDIVPDYAAGTLRVERNLPRLPQRLRSLFPDGLLCGETTPEEVLALLQSTPVKGLRISQEVAGWLEARHRLEERVRLERHYEQMVQSGQWPAHETLVPLYPYQRDGMLHLAFRERAMLADEMGLGKTIQAIAACALLHRLGQARRVLVVTPLLP